MTAVIAGRSPRLDSRPKSAGRATGGRGVAGNLLCVRAGSVRRLGAMRHRTLVRSCVVVRTDDHGVAGSRAILLLRKTCREQRGAL